MNSTIVENPLRAPSRFNGLFLWCLIGLILIGSTLVHFGEPTPDISWLITISERVLAGEIAYVDILETNPPVPALLYMPAVLMGRVFCLPPELTLVIITYLCGLLVLLLAGSILRANAVRPAHSHGAILLATTIVLFVLPVHSFAQREFFAALFALPIICVFVRHVESGEWPSVAARTLAAVLASLTLAIKPPLFSLPGIFICVYYFWHTGRASFLFASGIFYSGLLAILITGTTLALFPEYFGEVWTLMRDVYVPATSHPLAFLNDDATIATLVALIVTVLLQLGQRPSRSVWIFVCAGIGFLVSYFVQGKYISYQVYPAAVIFVIALVLAGVERLALFAPTDRVLKLVSLTALGFVCALVARLLITGLHDTRPELTDYSWTADLKSATIMAISPDIATAFPLTRQIGGVWVDRAHSQWVARFSRHMLKHDDLSAHRRQLLKKYHKQDLVRLIDSIEKNRPDIILVSIAPDDLWLSSELHQLKSDLLDDYKVIAEDGHIRALQRR